MHGCRSTPASQGRNRRLTEEKATALPRALAAPAPAASRLTSEQVEVVWVQELEAE